MGESSLPLAEASVGKNAERDSHEPGAREPSINNAAARVGGRGSQSRSAREGGRTSENRAPSVGLVGFQTPVQCVAPPVNFF